MANMRKNIIKNTTAIDIKDNTIEKSNTIKITAIICVLMIILSYGVSALIYKFADKQVPTSIKQYNIRSSVVFDMPEEEYYVIFYDKTGTDSVVLNPMIDSYRKSGKNSIYVVDLSKDYNKSLINTQSNVLASNSSELKISGSTLIKINNGQNKGYYESIFLIENELKN